MGLVQQGPNDLARRLGINPVESLIGTFQTQQEIQYLPNYRQWRHLLEAELTGRAGGWVGRRCPRRARRGVAASWIAWRCSPPAASCCSARQALIDRREWDAWLALYVPDCVFWVPTWTGDDRLCADPQRELSHIYYATRSGLEDRVWRIRSGLSIASIPMPRTMHAITNIRLVDATDATLSLEANWAVDVFSIKHQASHRLFGRYEHRLVLADGSWRIRAQDRDPAQRLSAERDRHLLGVKRTQSVTISSPHSSSLRAK
ncbi:MAG: aromatic-ring-hydroxylating dioxygenase subunit beta, partial [Pseudomonadota bacterium]